MKSGIGIIIFLLAYLQMAAQETDSMKTNTLKEVKVKTVLSNVERMPSVVGTRIWVAKNRSAQHR